MNQDERARLTAERDEARRQLTEAREAWQIQTEDLRSSLAENVRARDIATDRAEAAEAKLRAATDILAAAQKIAPGIITTAGSFALGDVAEARAERDVWQKNAVAANRRIEEVEAERDAAEDEGIAGRREANELRVERDRLRDALRWIAMLKPDQRPGHEQANYARAVEAVKTAQDALAESEETT